MCEYVAGELILCFPKTDDAARELMIDIGEKRIEHVRYVESLNEKLSFLHLEPDKDLAFELHRVRVPPGEEMWKITYLQFFYKVKLLEFLGRHKLTQEFLDVQGRSDYQFTVAPNSLLTLTTRPLGNAPVHATNFSFSSFHHQYKSAIGIPVAAPHNLNQVTVAILDSGVAGDITFPITDGRNFVDPTQFRDLTDENGHGTVISLILHDLAPTAKFIIYKVADAEGRASEWDTLAALATCGQSHIINLSLQFGIEDRTCSVCGRESHSSRSAVFENILGQFDKRAQRPLLVAAAGNSSLSELAFPARFANVFAIGAINSKGKLSAESNYGYQYNQPGTLDNHFVLPGGDDATVPPETIGEFGPKDAMHWHGTSFATAYASGLLANFLAQQGTNVTYSNVLDNLRQTANRGILLNYDPKKHGHGILQL
jgi:subtilisin family serine protease